MNNSNNMSSFDDVLYILRQLQWLLQSVAPGMAYPSPTARHPNTIRSLMSSIWKIRKPLDIKKYKQCTNTVTQLYKQCLSEKHNKIIIEYVNGYIIIIAITIMHQRKQNQSGH